MGLGPAVRDGSQALRAAGSGWVRAAASSLPRTRRASLNGNGREQGQGLLTWLGQHGERTLEGAVQEMPFCREPQCLQNGVKFVPGPLAQVEVVFLASRRQECIRAADSVLPGTPDDAPP